MIGARCIGIFGRRGSGKTTRLKKLLKGERRVVLFDPMDEHGGRAGFVRVDELAGVLACLKAGWRSGFKIAYVPTVEHPRMLHGLAKLIWDAQAPYSDGRDRRTVVLAVEEMNLGYPAGKLPASLFGMTRCVLQGRHRGIGIIGVSQRPALVSGDFRGNLDELYALPQSSGLDHKAVLEVIGSEERAALKALQPFHWLHLSDGQVKPGRDEKPR